MEIDDLCDTNKVTGKLHLIAAKYNYLAAELTILFDSMRRNKKRNDEMIDNLPENGFPENFFSYGMNSIEYSIKATKIIKEMKEIREKIDSIKIEIE
jgi:predicted RNA-binding protein with EMAP domain